jgi:hypothetical protein
MTQFHTNCIPNYKTSDRIATTGIKTNDLQIFLCDVGEDIPRVKGLLDEAVVVLRKAQTIQRLVEIRGSHDEGMPGWYSSGAFFSGQPR